MAVRWVREILGASWGSWQAVTPMRRPGREAFVGEASQGRGRSDFREDVVREIPHLGPIRHEDAGMVTLSGLLRPFSGRKSRAGNALST